MKVTSYKTATLSSSEVEQAVKEYISKHEGWTPASVSLNVDSRDSDSGLNTWYVCSGATATEKK